MNTRQHPAFRRQAGMTLVELMVSLALGVLLLFGVGALFSQNKQSYKQNEDLARLQEDARFALEEIGRDVSMAGFLAEIVDPSAIFIGNNAATEGAFDGAMGTDKNCGPAGLGNNWYYFFDTGLVENSMAMGDNVASGAAAAGLFSCINAGQFETGTDIIGIKRTGGVPSGTVNLGAAPPVNAPAPNGAVYIRENGTRGVMFQSPNFPSAAGGAAANRIVPEPYEEWEYTPRVYFVRNFGNVAGDGIPTLCRFRLQNNGAAGAPPSHVEECLAQGVEDLQLEFGLDTNDDGAANVYVAAPNAADLARTVSVRIYLLMRTINLDVGYRDNRSYTVSNKAAYQPADRFHRRLYASTVMVRNVNNLRQLGF